MFFFLIIEVSIRNMQHKEQAAFNQSNQFFYLPLIACKSTQYLFSNIYFKEKE